jgi:hypothetical protein
MKEAMRQHYACTHPTNKDVTKCLVLGAYFSTRDVVNGHIVKVAEKIHLELIGLSQHDLFNYRNGILMHREIERVFTQNEVVRIPVVSVHIF